MHSGHEFESFFIQRWLQLITQRLVSILDILICICGVRKAQRRWSLISSELRSALVYLLAFLFVLTYFLISCAAFFLFSFKRCALTRLQWLFIRVIASFMRLKSFHCL